MWFAAQNTLKEMKKRHGSTKNISPVLEELKKSLEELNTKHRRITIVRQTEAFLRSKEEMLRKCILEIAQSRKEVELQLLEERADFNELYNDRLKVEAADRSMLFLEGVGHFAKTAEPADDPCPWIDVVSNLRTLSDATNHLEYLKSLNGRLERHLANLSA